MVKIADNMILELLQITEGKFVEQDWLKRHGETIHHVAIKVSDIEKEGYAGSYISQYVKALKSWLNHNHKELNGRVKIKGVGDTPSLRNERTPTNEELRAVFLIRQEGKISSSPDGPCGSEGRGPRELYRG